MKQRPLKCCFDMLKMATRAKLAYSHLWTNFWSAYKIINSTLWTSLVYDFILFRYLIGGRQFCLVEALRQYWHRVSPRANPNRMRKKQKKPQNLPISKSMKNKPKAMTRSVEY